MIGRETIEKFITYFLTPMAAPFPRPTIITIDIQSINEDIFDTIRYWIQPGMWILIKPEESYGLYLVKHCILADYFDYVFEKVKRK